MGAVLFDLLCLFWCVFESVWLVLVCFEDVLVFVVLAVVGYCLVRLLTLKHMFQLFKLKCDKFDE